LRKVEVSAAVQGKFDDTPVVDHLPNGACLGVQERELADASTVSATVPTARAKSARAVMLTSSCRLGNLCFLKETLSF